MKRVKEIKNLALNKQVTLCNECKRWNGEFTEDDRFVCKYNNDNKGLFSGATLSRPQNYKCKYFKRDSKYNTVDLRRKNYKTEINNRVVKVKYYKGKFKRIKVKRYKVEFDGYYKGFRYVIVFQSMGHRCGYVEIPKDNKLYGKDYEDININCHGGLTYSKFNNRNYPVEYNNGYFIGFDCSHCGDGKNTDLAREYDIIGSHTYKELKEIETMFPIHGEEVRSFEYVKDECKSIIDQIINMEG